MALDIIEAVSGMGVHFKDIPPNIFLRQMKVRLLALSRAPRLSTTSNKQSDRLSGSRFLSITPPFSAPKPRF